jgi:hypothetical protein
LGKGRSVIDAIADHCHRVALFLQSTNFGDLVGGKHLGDHTIDADFCANGFSGALVVAGEQHDFKSERVKIGDCLGARWLESIGNNKNRMSGKRIAVVVRPTCDDCCSARAFGVDAGLVKFGIDRCEQ